MSGLVGAPAYFGWLVGSASGLYALVIITILIATAPPYHRDVPRMNDARRNRWQWVLTILLGLVLLVAWAAGALCVGRDQLDVYAVAVALGMIAVFAPILLLLMFTAAQWVGRSAAR